MSDLAKALVLFSIGFASFSAYQTAMGYWEIDPVIAWILAAFTSVFFVLLNRTLVERKSAGRSTFRIFAFYFVVLAISFGGNFVTFYSNLVKDRFFEDVLLETRNSLLAVDNFVRTRINDINGDIDKHEELLIQQVNRVGYEGCGEECLRIIADINKDLLKYDHGVQVDVDQYVTKESPLNTSLYFKKQFVSIRDKLTSDITKLVSSDSARIFNTVKKMQSLVNNKSEMDVYKSAYSDGVDLYNLLISKFSGRIPDISERFPIQNQKSHLEFGQIVYSYELAFIRLTYPVYTVFGVFLSLFIDLAMPIAIALLITEKPGSKIKRPSIPEMKSRTFMKKRSELSKK